MNEATPIKKGRKFDQVLEGAREVFLADGFEGASVDAIAKAAGVSKATLYSYFPDKKLLFMEVAKAECGAQIEQAGGFLNQHSTPREALHDAAGQIVRFGMSDFAQAIFRMCVAESERFPELGREFFRTGPKVFRDKIRDYLATATAAGQLEIDDVELAADLFKEICNAKLFAERVFNMRKGASEEEMDRIINGAVDMFLARYSV